MLPDPPFADADRPPDTTRTAVAVRLPAGGTAALAPSLVRRVDVEPFGFLDREREPHPVRHTFALTVGQPHAIEHGAEMAWSDSPYMRERMQARVDAVAAVRPAPLDLEAELRLLDQIDQTLARAPDEEAMAKAVKDEYRSAAQAAVAALEREHAPRYHAVPSALDYRVGFRETLPAADGLVVAQLVLDEFPRRDVRAPRNGESWFWQLDAQEVPQYTTMEALVRDVVDAGIGLDITPMARGSLWWVRALHVHPRCRGEQLGGRLLAHALYALVRGPYDLVVLEAHPEPPVFAAAPEPPGHSGWDRYEPPSRAAVEGLARYFGRMGFTRADDPERGAEALRGFLEGMEPQAPPDDAISRAVNIHENGPPDPEHAVAMYAYVGNLRFRGWPRLGRRV